MSKKSDLYDDNQELRDLAFKARMVVRVVGIILTTFFIALIVKKIPSEVLYLEATIAVLTQASVLIYYFFPGTTARYLTFEIKQLCSRQPQTRDVFPLMHIWL